jgi:anti-sigma28 factor (negative regulator of flagellin synthesis)
MRTDLNPETQSFPESGRTTSQSRESADAHSHGEGLPGEDRAQLSGGYVQIRALAAQATQLAELGPEKVSALRLMVSRGSYKPSPEQAADALFAHMMVQSAVWPRRS